MKVSYISLLFLVVSTLSWAANPSAHPLVTKLNHALKTASAPATKLDSNDMLMVYGGQDIGLKAPLLKAAS